ncbi:MAG: rhodanese-like domain-containing protein [Bacteroidota bacterium]|nr:rhodanese-like domain-containing protein [Flavisolibacter sp.]MDQ3551389.1 rhodanese-like domain-containing protein [Bacteroidota bacterium]
MKNITAEELKEKIDKGEKIILIDVREPHEYAEANMGGKLFPLNKIQTMQVEDIENLKEEEIIIHCRSGHRSMMACHVLDQLGFTNTKNLTGGIEEWQNKYGDIPAVQQQ